MHFRPGFRLMAALFGLSACTGQIGVPGAGSERDRSGSAISGNESGAQGPAGDCGDPGLKVLQRLNNAEYDNTVRDLLGDSSQPARAFPPDGVALGFDNEAEVLSTSPLLVEKYAQSALSLVESALGDVRRPTVVGCDVTTDGCVLGAVREFAKRAFRRPLDADTDQRLAALISGALAKGASGEQALRTALRAVLLSPRFLFRPEFDADPNSTAIHALDPYELASRLSYFVWSSMPDAALLAAAESGALATPEQIRGAVVRLLSDPKAAALTANFAGQYLGIRQVATAAPNAKFTSWNEELRPDLTLEAGTFFSSFLSENKPLTELLTANYGYLNDRLAGYYGLPLPGSQTLVRTTLAPGTRGGVLLQGAWLLVTSTPTRTSPVRRGKWVLGQLLCEEPPPPPPDVAALVETETPTGTLREQMEQHRASPACAGCHALMDPIGLAFEHYDAIGRHRDTDAGFAIDATGSLSEERAFDGPFELASLIAADPAFPRCFSGKLFRYALGRSENAADACLLDGLANQASAGSLGMTDLVLAIATSDAFSKRRGGSEP